MATFGCLTILPIYWSSITGQSIQVHAKFPERLDLFLARHACHDVFRETAGDVIALGIKSGAFHKNAGDGCECVTVEIGEWREAVAFAADFHGFKKIHGLLPGIVPQGFAILVAVGGRAVVSGFLAAQNLILSGHEILIEGFQPPPGRVHGFALFSSSLILLSSSTPTLFKYPFAVLAYTGSAAITARVFYTDPSLRDRQFFHCEPGTAHENPHKFRGRTLFYGPCLLTSSITSLTERTFLLASGKTIFNGSQHSSSGRIRIFSRSGLLLELETVSSKNLNKASSGV